MIYKCSFCGQESEDVAKVQTCEAQGIKRAYHDEAAVELSSFPEIPDSWFSGTVKTVRFEEISHAPVYAVIITDQNHEACGRMIEAVEEHMRVSVKKLAKA